MAKKEPETIERYQIFATTTLEQMGFVLAALTKMGLKNIGYELITDVLQFKARSPRKVVEVSNEDFATEWINEHPSFKAIDLANYFKANDRPPNSAYGQLKNMVATGALRKLDGGNYQRADVKAIEGPKKTRKRGDAVQYEVPNKQFLLDAIKGRKVFTMTELRAAFVADGRNEKSVSPIVTKLTQAKVIRQISPGRYMKSLVKAKAKAKAAKPKKNEATEAPEQLTLNGAMMNGSGEAAHV